MRMETITVERKNLRGRKPVSRAEFEALLDRMEDLEDQFTGLKAEARGLPPDHDSVPGEVVHRILRGEPPLLVWREYRNLTQKALAAKAGLKSHTYISEIEKGLKPGSAGTLKKLAKILDCSIDDLLN